MCVKYFGLFYKGGKIRHLHSLIFTWIQRVKSKNMYRLFINEKKLFFIFTWLAFAGLKFLTIVKKNFLRHNLVMTALELAYV